MCTGAKIAHSLCICLTIVFIHTQLNEIMPGHYADIVEERSIAKLCGYPLCSNRLSKVWSISLPKLSNIMQSLVL